MSAQSQAQNLAQSTLSPAHSHTVFLTQYQLLKQDFEYNLKLLEERDEELEHADMQLAALQAHVQEQQQQLNSLQQLQAETQSGAGLLAPAG